MFEMWAWLWCGADKASIFTCIRIRILPIFLLHCIIHTLKVILIILTSFLGDPAQYLPYPLVTKMISLASIVGKCRLALGFLS